MLAAPTGQSDLPRTSDILLREHICIDGDHYTMIGSGPTAMQSASFDYRLAHTRIMHFALLLSSSAAIFFVTS